MGDITPVNNNNNNNLRIANASSDLTNDRTAVPSPSPETPPENGENGHDHDHDHDHDGHAVDVEAAKAQFEALRRTLSHASSLHRVQSGQKSLEAPDDDDFDLKAYLVCRPSHISHISHPARG
jgi:hypothetical protein